MTTLSWDRSRRVAATVSVFTVIAVVVAALVLVLGVGVPQGWWPHTGQAFASDTSPAHHDHCASIVGPAKRYCERGATTTAADQQDMAAAAWRLVPAGAGVAALVVWRLRHTAGQRWR
ncbi:hypothetical protein [Streptomyces zaehneri]|uniref:hypothetical protein n=1 Tax=Streptomyces zaehneri TaxID=3051180 RepID=UPI0028D88812|nr:hypothetical protein [Streptomyces sp. DSM 40713]